MPSGTAMRGGDQHHPDAAEDAGAEARALRDQCRAVAGDQVAVEAAGAFEHGRDDQDHQHHDPEEEGEPQGAQEDQGAGRSGPCPGPRLQGDRVMRGGSA